MAAKEVMLGADWRSNYEPEVQAKIEAGFRTGQLLQVEIDAQTRRFERLGTRGVRTEELLPDREELVRELEQIQELRTFIARDIEE